MQQSRQEIEKNNLGAQLSKLRTRTALAVAQTREAVELKEGHLLEVENLENELTEKREELSQVISSIQTRKKQLLVVANAINQMASESQNDVLRRQNEIDALNIQIRDKEAKTGTLDREIATLESILLVIEEQVNNHKEIAQQELGELEEQIQYKRDELKEFSEKASEAIVGYDALVNETIEQETKLEEKKEQIKNRETELATISEEHTQRRLELDQREADYRIIGRRLKKEYEKTFPTRKLTI